MSKVTYKREYLKDILEEMKPLLHTHNEEMGIDVEEVTLDVMWDTYLTLEEADILHVVIARDGEDIVGYYASYIQPHIHYANEVFSSNDTIYLKPEYRKGFTGIRLIKETEKQMRERGVTLMAIVYKEKQPIDRLLTILGWSPEERTWLKYLGDS